MNVQQLANKYADQFRNGTRDNGEPYLWVQDADSNLSDLIRDAHGDFMPDDYKYQFIHEALEALADNADPDDIQLEADCYNSDLLKWLSSNLHRISYCNEVMAVDIDNGATGSFMDIVSNAQYEEKRDVLSSVRNSLELLTGDNE